MLSVVLTDATVEPGGPPRPAPAGRRPDLGPAHASTATRARTTRCSCWPRARPGRRSDRGRRRLAGRAARRAIEAVARDLARQQAADGEGATTLLTCQVSGASRRRRGPGGRPGRRVEQPGQGRRPRPRPELGPDRRRRRATPDWPTPRSSRPAGCPPPRRSDRAGRPATVDPDRLRIAIAGHARVRRTGRWPGHRSIGVAARAAMDAPGDPHPARSRPRRRRPARPSAAT